MKKQIQHYILSQVLGQGSFGKVYKGIHTLTNQQFAVKVIPVQKFQQNSRLQSCSANEIKNLTRIEHSRHIIRFVEMLKTPNNFYFVYEYCNGRTLDARMRDEGRVEEREALRIFGQLLEAFKVLNKYNIMHRDLKPDNIFFHNGDAKLGDFGFCKSLMTQDDMTSTMLGSPIYMAPEVLRGEIYTSKADIWSLGVVLYEMIYGHCPFESNSIAKLIAVLDQEELKFPTEVEVSSSTKELIRKLLIKDQFKRTDWFQLLTMNMNIENRAVISVTQSLSAVESEKLSSQLRKYNMRANQDSTEPSITSSQSSKLLNSCKVAPTQPKALTFRKKSDQNSNKPAPETNRLAKTVSLKSPESNPECHSPRQYYPLTKVQPNIPASPGFQRKPSLQLSKRSSLLATHNSCVSALRTCVNFIKSNDPNSSLFSLIILRRIQHLLTKMTQSISFSQLDLQDILSTSSQELRCIQKQIKEIEREGNFDFIETFAVKSTLRYYYNEHINKHLWYEMICFLEEERCNVVNRIRSKTEKEGEEKEWTKVINSYLMV